MLVDLCLRTLRNNNISKMASSGRHCVGGHTKSVLSVSVTSPPNIRIISGGESGELSVWAPDGTNMHSKTISEDDVTSIVCSATKPDHVYVACGEKIYQFDLRQFDEPVTVCHYNEDEINQLALHKTENYLAAADDSGHIKVVNLAHDDMKVYKTLRKHTNICASLCFAPNKTWDMYSAGYDSLLIQWNFSKSRSCCLFEMKDLEDTRDDVESFVASPPFVHSLTVSHGGGALACGTENGVVHVFDCTQRLACFRKSLYGHSQGVSQVLIPNFLDDKYLVSCGNDTRICFWDLEGLSISEAAATGKSNGTSKKRKPPTAVVESVAKQPEKPKFEIMYDDKVNCIASGSTTNENFLVIADTTTSPFILTFPLM